MKKQYRTKGWRICKKLPNSMTMVEPDCVLYKTKKEAEYNMEIMAAQMNADLRVCKVEVA